MTANGPILAIDTATTHAVIALGAADGTLLDGRAWLAGYRHGEELLARIEALLGEHALRPADLGGIAVGTGPGAFTGLRVGIATAKALAHALGLPIVGVATGSALLAAAAASASAASVSAAAAASGARDAASDASDAASDVGAHRSVLVLLQPAGPNDRVFLRPGEPARILPGGTDPDLRDGERLVAVDLAGRAPDAAVALGVAATDGLGEALVSAAAARLAAGDADDLARLVPEYVTLPRGVRAVLPDEGVELSGGKPGPRP